jgi:hypothetical protein
MNSDRWVKTELGNSIAAAIGMKEAPITEAQSAAGVFEQVRETLDSGAC